MRGRAALIRVASAPRGERLAARPEPQSPSVAAGSSWPLRAASRSSR
jgi:hypothetical protein